MRKNYGISFPCLEAPLRCYISNLNQDKRIGCNKEGGIFSTDHRQEWEEWYILADDDGSYELKNCAHNKFLHINHGGHIHTSDSSSYGDEDALKWKIRKSEGCTYTLNGLISDRHLVMDDDGNVCATKDPDINQEWHIEFISGELCFISSSESRQLSCHPWSGKLSMSQNSKGWEVWRFMEAGDGRVRISNWTHKDKMLYCGTDGIISTTDTRDVPMDLCKWEVQRAPHGFHGVTIRSFHGKYLSVTSGNICTQDSFTGQHSTWQLGAGNSKHFFLSSLSRDKRIGSTKNGEVSTTHNRKDQEIWQLSKLDNDDFALRSEKHGKYLGSCPNGTVHATQHLTDSEKWHIERSDSGAIQFVSKEHNRYLVINDGGIVTNLDSSDENCLWTLEPKMPDTITGDKMRNLAIGGSVAAASIMVAPFVVMGIVGALGFTSSGIAAGSVGAGMMSAEAIASGGMIATGGTVATLQSIGAAGLGLAGTSAAMGAGAFVGASAVGIAASVPGGGTGNDRPSTQDESMKIASNRPFCEWHRWEKH